MAEKRNSGRNDPSVPRPGPRWLGRFEAEKALSRPKHSPTAMYRDFAVRPQLFHWESQSTTNSASPTGQRYINHRRAGTNVLLFVRETKANALGTSPDVFLGPADYVRHEGSRPMAVTRRLCWPMLMEIFLASRAAA